MKLYVSKAELSRLFGISPPTVCKKINGIEKEIESGRYNRYAIADNLISVAVFADYVKYGKRLEKKNLRKTVPPFDMMEALAYLDGSEYENAVKATAEEKEERMQVRSLLEKALQYL